MKHELDLARRYVEMANVRTERAERDRAQRRLNETAVANAVPRRVLVDGPGDEGIGDHDDEQGEPNPAVKPLPDENRAR